MIIKTCSAAILVIGLMLPVTPASAGEDACKVVLCLFGELKGASGGVECKSSIAQYFSIVKTKKKGKFDPSGTAKARLSFLNQCSENTTGEKKEINEKYGRRRGL
jgi:hypothetical protein